MDKKVCFVVQGFGPKTDYTDGRVLNLDASYEVVKQAVEEAGLRCVRADEIVHSGTIDIPMYEQLLRADLVIADLSTYNVNAAFELGVRYGLRPYSTIVLAEEKFKSPFDINHIVIRRYKHLGEDIGRREAERFKDDLKKVIAAILADARTDSPVYSMLPGLSPPLEAALAKVSEKLAEEPPLAPESAPRTTRGRGVAPEVGAGAPAATRFAAAPPPEPPSAREWLERAQQAMKQGDFVGATGAWSELLKLSPSDNHAVQQLALATYKSKQPDADQALQNARRILEALSPATTNDPETLGLWGAIHKRLWDLHRREAELSEAIGACERGFSLKQDHYNGINLAFMLNIRAVESARRGDVDEAVADSVQANRVRRDLTRYALPLVEREDLDDEKRYWVVSTLYEAAVGLGDAAGVARWESRARSLRVPDWMQQTREEQAERLKALQGELAQLRASAS